MGKLLLLFVLVPILETVLLVRIGQAVGWAGTLALILLTGVVGSWLARLQGLRAWRVWRDAVTAGRVPEEGALEGLLLLLGGVCLITPGVVTDALGLLMLITPTRRWAASALRAHLVSPLAEQAPGVVGDSPAEVFRVVHGGGGDRPGSEWQEAAIGRVGEGPTRRSSPDRAAIRRPVREIIDADFEVKPGGGRA